MPNRSFLRAVVGAFTLLCFSPSFAAIELVDETVDALTLSLSMGQPKQTRVTRAGRRYVDLSYVDAELAREEGAPSVPFSSALVSVPLGRRLVLEAVEIADETTRHLPFDLAFEKIPPVHAGARVARRNARAYARVYGERPVVIEEHGTAAGEGLARVRFHPVRYDARSRSLVARGRILAHFRYEAMAIPTLDDSRAEGDFSRFLVVNPSPASRVADSRAPVDLVIAHASYQMSLQRYLFFKEDRGREPRVHYVDGKSAEAIKAIIANEYQGRNPPATTLLIGHIDQIPSWRGSGDNAWTDYPYTTLDGDQLPDVALGRVPAHTIDELRTFVDKAISRELEKGNIDDVLVTAGKDTSLGCPANASKVGTKLKGSSARTKIIRKFRTEVGTQEVIAGYNGSPNLVIYDGHGMRDGMTEIPLLISNITALTNGGFPLVFDIACLNANWGAGAKTRNFAESILLSTTSGVAGILASGGSGYGHDFFQTMADLMAKARESSTNPRMNEVGWIVLAAKSKHGAQDRSYWNYYGDPASRIW